MAPSKINIVAEADRKSKKAFHPFIVGDVNASQAKVAKFGEVFDWRAYEKESEAFLVLRGEIAIDFRAGVTELAVGDFVVAPNGVEHRRRSLTGEPIVPMFEPAATLNTGDIKSDLIVAELERL
jgi:mannose-6-phosphate isomerase-like protein (cupin superfamily)